MAKKILGKNAEVFVRKKGSEEKKPEILQDVFFDRKNTTLSLRKKLFVIAIDPAKIKEFLFYHSTALSILMFTLLFVGIASVSFTSKASIAKFYPESCLGGWKNTHNAEGEPDVPLGSDLEDFHSSNSAFLKNTQAELYCGSFNGEIPVDTSPKTFTLKFSWSIDDGSVLHAEPEIEEESTTDISVESSNESTEVQLDDADDDPNVTSEDIAGSDEVSEDIGETVTDPIEDEIEIVEQEAEIETPTESVPQETDDGATDTESTVRRNTFFSFVTKAFAEDETEAVEEPQVSDVPPESASQDIPEETVIEDLSEEVAEEDISNDISPLTPDRGQLDILEEVNMPEVIDTETVENIEPSSGSGGGSDDHQDTDTADTNETEEIFSPKLLEVLYSVDGTTWQEIGTVTYESWVNETFVLPVNKWSDLHTVQVALRPVPSLDEPPVIYVDSMYIEVEYDDVGLDRGIQPNFFADELLYDETFGTLRVIKIRRNDVVELWYSDLTEASLIPDIPIEAIEETSKAFFDEQTLGEESGIEIDTLESPSANVEIIEIVDPEEEQPLVDEDIQPSSDEQNNDDVIEFTETETETGDQDQMVQAMHSVIALAEPIVFTKNEAPPELIETGEIIEVPSFELTQDVRLGLVATLPARRALSTAEKESAGALFWHLVTVDTMVDDETPVVYKDDKLYWLSDDQTIVYMFNIPQQLLLSEFFDTDRFIVDLRAFDKIDTFEELATHTCTVMPFSLSLASGSEKEIEVALSQHALGVGFTIETGGIPEGLSISFEKDASSKMITGKQSTVYIPGTVSVAPTVPDGSYTIVVIVSELYTGQMLPNFCQLNVVVSPAT